GRWTSLSGATNPGFADCGTQNIQDLSVSSRAMAPDVTPDQLRNAEFRTTLRGWDRAEVKSILAIAARQIEDLQAKCGMLETKLAVTPAQEMTSEFEQVGNEVTAIIQAAREAAESLRERASIDAAPWRREAA